MCLSIIAHLIGHSRFESKNTPVLKLSLHLALQAQNDMSFAAPVIGQIARRIFHFTNANVSEHQGLPDGFPSFAFMKGSLNGFPLGRMKWMRWYFHCRSPLLPKYCLAMISQIDPIYLSRDTRRDLSAQTAQGIVAR